MFQASKPLLRRLDAIHRELKAGHFLSAGKLAKINETSEKTALEDLHYLRDEKKAPLEYSAKRRGWHYTCQSFELPRIEMTEGEVVALFFPQEMLRQHQGMPYEAELALAINKLTEMLPDQISIHNRSAFEQVHSFRSSVVNLHDVEIFRKLADAVMKRKQIQVRYFTASREKESSRVIDPVHLALVNGEWYLIGYCHTRKERRTFVPSRIKQLELTGKPFTPPHDFHIGNYLNGAFSVVREEGEPVHEVKLRFARSAAKYIREKIWHGSQRSTVRADGSIELSMLLGSLIEVRRWILSWGSECEVLAPLELRKEIAHEAAIIAARPTAPSEADTARHKRSKKLLST